MKKIMFNDEYCLTKAVLDGRKTMTRRSIPILLQVDAFDKFPDNEGARYDYALSRAPYKVGDVIAVAQSYHSLNENGYIAPEWCDHTCEDSAGYKNKMFVRADLMPNRIRITDIRIERLQDISDEDCLREGIYNWKDAPDCPTFQRKSEIELYGFDGSWDGFISPRAAIAHLFDKIFCQGTWEQNPYVFVYEFELVK